jgi:hypothetical protein
MASFGRDAVDFEEAWDDAACADEGSRRGDPRLRATMVSDILRRERERAAGDATLGARGEARACWTGGARPDPHLSEEAKRHAIARGSADRPPPRAAYAALVDPPDRRTRRSRRISVPVERATGLVADRTDVVAFRLSPNPLEKKNTNTDAEPRGDQTDPKTPPSRTTPTSDEDDDITSPCDPVRRLVREREAGETDEDEDANAEEASDDADDDDECGEAVPKPTAALAPRKRPRDVLHRATRVAASLTECLARMDAAAARRRVRSGASRDAADDDPPTTFRPPIRGAPPNPSAILRRTRATAIRLAAAARHARAAHVLAKAALGGADEERDARPPLTRAPPSRSHPPPPPPHHGCARAVPWGVFGASSTIRAADPDDRAAFGRRYDGDDAWDVAPESRRGDRRAAAAYRLLPPPGDPRFERTRAMARRIFAASRTTPEGYREEAIAAAAEVLSRRIEGGEGEGRGRRNAGSGSVPGAFPIAARGASFVPATARYSVARDRARRNGDGTGTSTGAGTGTGTGTNSGTNTGKVPSSVGGAPPFTRRAEARVRALRPYFRVDRSKIHGAGVYAMSDVPAREILMEYVGEVIRRPVADRRESAARRRVVAAAAAEGRSPTAAELASASTYMFTLDHASGRIVDAAKKGNVTRWVNHSCEPNCATRCVVLDGKRRVVLYSTRDVDAGEELTYDYQFAPDAPENAVPCACGAPACRGTINVRVVDPPAAEGDE